MIQQPRSVTPEELVLILSQEGWTAVGGADMRDAGWRPSRIQTVEYVGADISIRLHPRGLLRYHYNQENVTITQSEPWLIEIREMVLRQQPCKKADGGGFRGVSVERISLKLRNISLEASLRSALALTQEKATAQAARRAGEACAARKAAALAELNERYAGEVITDISISEETGALCIHTQSGQSFSVALTGGDTCDAWMVAGDKDDGFFSLADFQKVSPHDL